MELQTVLVLRGPNVWNTAPVLEVCLELNAPADLRSDRLTTLRERLVAYYASLPSGKPVSPLREALLERLGGPISPAELLARLTLELQSLAGGEGTFFAVEPAADDGTARFAVEYDEEALGRACLSAARDLWLAPPADVPELQRRIRQLQEVAESVCLGPSTRCIVRAARERGIPFIRLDTRSLVQLGYGARQCRIRTAESDHTSVIGEYISQDKDLTKRLLRSAGVPVPEGRAVSDPEDAWAAACEIGLPVVVKPLNGNHGRGVFTDLTKEADIKSLFHQALAEGDGVLVERCAQGAEHRLLVVNGRVVAATRGDPVVATGDGKRSIIELMDELNRDPRRGDTDDCPLSKLEFDPTTAAAVRVQGYEPESIPPVGAPVVLQRNGNLSADVTDRVHPQVAHCAAMAARAVGLDIAGIDCVAEDIARPLEVQRGAIIEVNASPGLQMHLQPLTGLPRPVGEAIVAYLFPEGQTGRIPIVGVLDGREAAPTVAAVDPLLSAAFGQAATTRDERVYLNGQPITLYATSRTDTIRALLINPVLASAAFQVTAADVLSDGLGFDRCQVAVLTPAGSSATESASRARAAGVLLRSVDSAGAVVCHADDPLTADASAACPGRVILVAEDGAHPALCRHRAEGGTAVFIRQGTIVLAEGDRELWTAPAHGAAFPQLAAVAVARALRIPLERLPAAR